MKARYLLREKGVTAILKKDQLLVNQKPLTPEEIASITGEINATLMQDNITQNSHPDIDNKEKAEIASSQSRSHSPVNTAENFVNALNTIKSKERTSSRSGMLQNKISSDCSLDYFVVSAPRTTQQKHK